MDQTQSLLAGMEQYLAEIRELRAENERLTANNEGLKRTIGYLDQELAERREECRNLRAENQKAMTSPT